MTIFQWFRSRRDAPASTTQSRPHTPLPGCRPDGGFLPVAFAAAWKVDALVGLHRYDHGADPERGRDDWGEYYLMRDCRLYTIPGSPDEAPEPQ